MGQGPDVLPSSDTLPSGDGETHNDDDDTARPDNLTQDPEVVSFQLWMRYVGVTQADCPTLVYEPCAPDEADRRAQELTDLIQAGAKVTFSDSLTDLNEAITTLQPNIVRPTEFSDDIQRSQDNRRHREMLYKVVVVERIFIHEGNLYHLKPGVYGCRQSPDAGLDRGFDRTDTRYHSWQADLWVDFENLDTALLYLQLYAVRPTVTQSVEETLSHFRQYHSIDCTYPYPAVISPPIDSVGTYTVTIQHPT